LWHSVHIDDIHPPPEEIPSVAEMHGKSVSALLSSTKERPLGKHSDRIVKPKRQFHINYLIKKCLQPALGNVKDPASDSSRAIDRLKIILNCLQNDTGMYSHH